MSLLPALQPVASTRSTDGPFVALAEGSPSGSSDGRLARYVLLVAAVAIVLRVPGLDTWSLWEDEEGSLTRAHENLWWGFQKYFPLFFFALKQWVQWVGLSAGALRALPAAAGLLTIGFTMIGFRRRLGSGTLAVAGLLLAVNIGHVFFSQSVRYYTVVLLFEVLSLVWFFDGFESGRPWKLVLSLVALVLGLLTHFSALLLGPVFVGYLLLAAARGERGGGYRASWYLVYGLALGVVGAFFTWRMTLLRAEFDGGLGGALPCQRDPTHVGLTVIAYFGMPILGLGLLAPWLARELSRRTLLLLLVTAVVPVLELLTLATLNTVNVTWYYGFVAMVGFAVLAAASLSSLWVRGYRRAAVALTILSFGYYAAFLGLYYTTAHGDRPRWRDAAAFVQRETGVRPGNPANPAVFGNVPGPVNFYVGERPNNPERNRVIRILPADPDRLTTPAWFVVEERTLSAEYMAWFDSRCERLVRFESWTGPVDRSVTVYRYNPER